MTIPMEPNFSTLAPRDLRVPMIDETPLSGEEVRHGLREGLIACGPVAQRVAFADVLVVSRERVEVFEFAEVE